MMKIIKTTIALNINASPDVLFSRHIFRVLPLVNFMKMLHRKCLIRS